MSDTELRTRCPQDLVAIFHASFHPTRGNILDWSLKASDDLKLDNLEFSALPSGLHLVDQDVVYFTKNGQHGVCVFHRRKTSEADQRGFRLSSLGILLAKARRPRPWRHLAALKDVARRLYSQPNESDLLVPEVTDRSNDYWAAARAFFEERKVKRADLGGAGDWHGWSSEFNDIENEQFDAYPSLHLSHLLRILGPSSLTLYKHVLTRRRILIYTLPPVEAACILCQVAADMCFEIQQRDSQQTEDEEPSSSHGAQRLQGRSAEPIAVLGMVNLNDLDRLKETERGWIACTTDAIFLEKPNYYDLLIDLTTSTPNKATRPTMYSSKPLPPQSGSGRSPTHRLNTIRFSWSDVKLWNEVDRILQLDVSHNPHPNQDCCASPPDGSLRSKIVSSWTDVWRVYEDVCVICAGLWMGSWRGNSTMSYSTADGPENWGNVRSEGDDDLSIQGAYMRNLGMGIEGGPAASGSGTLTAASTATTLASPTTRAMRRTSNMSWTSAKTIVGTIPTTSPTGGSHIANGKARQISTSTTTEVPDDADYDTRESRDAQLRITLALLQTFHAHTTFQLSVLESFIPTTTTPEHLTIYLTPKDVLAFELGPFSGFDAKYLEWLAGEYARGVKFVVKRGWKDLFGAIFAYA